MGQTAMRHIRARDLRIPDWVGTGTSREDGVSATGVGLPSSEEEAKALRAIRQRSRERRLSEAGITETGDVSEVAIAAWDQIRSEAAERTWCVRLPGTAAGSKVAQDLARIALEGGFGVRCSDAQGLLEALKERFASHTADMLLRAYKTCGVLVIEDLAGVRRGDWALRTLAGIILERRSRGLLTVICGSDHDLQSAFSRAGDAWTGKDGVLASIGCPCRPRPGRAPRRPVDGVGRQLSGMVETLEARLVSLEGRVRAIEGLLSSLLPGSESLSGSPATVACAA